MMKKVSVIIPCYNGEKFVDRCLKSVLTQDYPDIEVIVVNDGSTDRSKEKILAWVTQFEKKGFKLVYVQQENRGLGGAVNTGLKYVSGVYLMLLDIDDEYLPGAISEKAEFLEKNSDMDVVRSNGWYVRDTGKFLFVYDKEEKVIEDVFTALLEGKTNNWAGSYMIRTRSLFRFYPNREIYSSRYGQNLQLLLPLTYKKKCGFIDKPHMNYIQQKESLSKTADTSISKNRSVENAQGYRDIRVRLIDQIVKSEKERSKYFNIVQITYLRNVMQIAIEYQDDCLFSKAYNEIYKYGSPSLDDRIKYCVFYCPQLVPFLRTIRKIKHIILKFK